MIDAARLTIARVHEGLRSRSFSARELTQSFLDRLSGTDATVHAFLTVTAEHALESADATDQRIADGTPLLPLDGIPVAIKDTLVTKGIQTTAASAILSGYIPPYTATAVQRMLDAGAVMVGKTNCDEFAMGASGENSAFGPTKNPWDITRVPGGSSSGSAAAVAAGQALIALGSDTGGSIRQPAGFCNIVGVKPTYGRVSRYGLIALASSLDQIGPLTRTVDDAARVLAVISGVDSHDASTVDVPGPEQPLDSVKGMRIGVPKEYFVDGIDSAVSEAVQTVLDELKKTGATLVDISLPHTQYALATYYIIQPAEASSNLARFDGIRYGQRADGKDLDEVYRLSRHQGIGPEAQRRIMLGTFTLSAGYYDAYYRKAQKVRTLIRKDFADAFQNVDAIVTPTSPGLPFPLGEKTSDPLTMYLADIFTVSANIAGIPGVSVPCGTVDQLPIGVQVLGPMWQEQQMLTVASAIEQMVNLPLRIPKIGA